MVTPVTNQRQNHDTGFFLGALLTWLLAVNTWNCTCFTDTFRNNNICLLEGAVTSSVLAEMKTSGMYAWNCLAALFDKAHISTPIPLWLGIC